MFKNSWPNLYRNGMKWKKTKGEKDKGRKWQQQKKLKLQLLGL